MFQPAARWLRLLVRCLFLAVLLALSIAIPNLSPRCGFASEKPSRDPDAPKGAKTERPPFDLTYLHPKAMGVIAIRPSAIFSDRAMKPLTAALNEDLEQLRQELSLSGEPKLSIKDIEEINGFMMVVPGDKKQGRDHSLRIALTMIRVKHDFDWVKLMRQIDPKMEEVRHEDRVCYHIHGSGVFAGTSPKDHMCCCVPDNRSLVFLYQKKTEAAFLKGQRVQRPHFSWDEDWKRVEHGLIAVAMDNGWAQGLSKEEIDSAPEWASLAQNAATMVAGVDWNDSINFQAFLACKNDASAQQTKRDVDGVLKKMRLAIDPAKQYEEADPTSQKDEGAAVSPERDGEERVWQNLLKIMKYTHVARREDTVCVHTTAKINIAELVRHLLTGISGTESSK